MHKLKKKKGQKQTGTGSAEGNTAHRKINTVVEKYCRVLSC